MADEPEPRLSEATVPPEEKRRVGLIVSIVVLLAMLIVIGILTLG